MGVKVGRSQFLTSLDIDIPPKEERKRKISVSGHEVIKVAKDVIHSSKVRLSLSLFQNDNHPPSHNLK